MNSVGIDNSAHSRQALNLVVGLTLGGLAVIAVYATTKGGAAAMGLTFAVGTMTSGACFVTGGLIGFLFGIPKVRQRQASDAENGGKQEGIQQNTNLEQISDWLTKVLVGVGLAQLGVMGTKYQEISVLVASGIGETSSDQVFVMVLLLYFLVCGFFFGYLGTRLLLPKAFREVDQIQEFLGNFISTLDTVEPKIDNPEALKVMKEQRENAERQLGTLMGEPGKRDRMLMDLAKEYDLVRRTMSRGSQRTVEMGRVIAKIRAIAGQLDFTPRQLKNLFEAGGEGSRVVALALVQVLRFPEALPIVVDGISHSRSAFEQYQALRAAEEIFSSLTPKHRQELVAAIEDQRKGGPGKYLIPENADRRGVSGRILRMAGFQIND